jgi:cytochrome c556
MTTSTTRWLVVLGVLGCVVLAGCSGEPADTHPQQLVTKRQAVFKQFAKTFEPMGLVARERKDYNPREFNVFAVELDQLASQPWQYFTADGNYPPSKTKPEAWTKPQEFKVAQENFQANVKKLLVVAQNGETEAIKSAVDTVQKSCKACHDDFRVTR